MQTAPLTSLTLNLVVNSIGEAGAMDLAAALRKPLQLTSLTLNLVINSIGDADAWDVAATLGRQS